MPGSSFVAGVPLKFRGEIGVEGPGVHCPVLLPGNCLPQCPHPPPPALERWLGGAPKGGAKGECAGVEPGVGLQVVLLLGGGVLAPL